MRLLLISLLLVLYPAVIFSVTAVKYNSSSIGGVPKKCVRTAHGGSLSREKRRGSSKDSSASHGRSKGSSSKGSPKGSSTGKGGSVNSAGSTRGISKGNSEGSTSSIGRSEGLTSESGSSKEGNVASNGGSSASTSDDGICDEDNVESANEQSPCTKVATGTLVTNAPSTTFRLELDIIASTDHSETLGTEIRNALQSKVAPGLTTCAEQRRRLLERALNVVFGPLALDRLRTCPDPTGTHADATCLIATGDVSVYGASADGFPAALSRAMEVQEALEVQGLIDIVSCIVRNATNEEPVPEGPGSKATDASIQAPIRAPEDGGEVFPPSAYIGIAVALVVLLLVVALLCRRRRSQHRSNSEMKESSTDEFTSCGSEGAIESVKMSGRANEEEQSEGSVYPEERIIDDDDSFENIAIYKLVTVVDIENESQI